MSTKEMIFKMASDPVSGRILSAKMLMAIKSGKSEISIDKPNGGIIKLVRLSSSKKNK
ncbi:MAG: hypothetical protein ACXWV5_09480 [Flavitalea sp.]